MNVWKMCVGIGLCIFLETNILRKRKELFVAVDG
jgi:hypothetical protein